ncbi:MAG: hypothetical protein R3Y54_11530 [Eubacteriales bacterium]
MEYVLYIVFFPKFTSGPIVLYQDMKRQFTKSSLGIVNYENIGKGLYLFTLGLSKKVLIADYLAGIVEIGYNNVASLTGRQSLGI